MAVVAALATERTAARLVRLAGLRVGARLRPALQPALTRALARIEYEKLFRPAACCAEVPATALDLRIGGATAVAVGLATVGPAISEAASRCFAGGDALTGVLLDQLGTAAIELMSRRLQAVVRAAARADGRRAGSAFHPGEPMVPLAAQASLLELSGAAEVGAWLDPSGAMQPPKSISMVIGIGPTVMRRTRQDTCRECKSYVRCRREGRC